MHRKSANRWLVSRHRWGESLAAAAFSLSSASLSCMVLVGAGCAGPAFAAPVGRFLSWPIWASGRLDPPRRRRRHHCPPSRLQTSFAIVLPSVSCLWSVSCLCDMCMVCVIVHKIALAMYTLVAPIVSVWVPPGLWPRRLKLAPCS